ncbi:hypothetical protein HWV62_19835 [Athelia sp. TMB]|nr:hypothetical protein HWV62_19835 [Athelia sp. TMB]
MPSLDDHGKLGAAIIPFYTPFLILSFILALRHGFGRNTGWIYLFILALMRVLGGALLIASELVRPINVSLYIAAAILEFAGLSPLLLATLGFVRSIVMSSYEQTVLLTRGFRLLYLIGLIGLVLSIYGGSEADTTDPKTLSNSTTLRHVGSILLAVLYLLLVGVHLFLWSTASRLDMHRRRLLTGISLALPFLGVRVAYSVVSTFSGSPIPDGSANTNKLAKFNLANGTWWIYLVMGLLMEYISICIYTIVGWKTPASQERVGPKEDGYPLEQQAGYGGQAPRAQYVAPYRV